MLKSSTNETGFTLIEVMVALAIFALAASMLMLSDGSGIKQAHYLYEKVLATQVADQYLNRLYTEQRLPEQGIHGCVEDYAGSEWYIREKISETPIAGFFQITVDVFAGAFTPEENDSYLSTLTTHMRASQQ
ncbi:MAG: type II secretion system minor pseudopilin GspI [Endozoicomonas sp. (ex Botrylloides leachii)]|nr:type II secretion system minor pseudopilin GspI [Endozoicomonas sp. (ex Botrylloides leachii)]